KESDGTGSNDKKVSIDCCIVHHHFSCSSTSGVLNVLGPASHLRPEVPEGPIQLRRQTAVLDCVEQHRSQNSLLVGSGQVGRTKVFANLAPPLGDDHDGAKLFTCLRQHLRSGAPSFFAGEEGDDQAARERRTAPWL